MGKHVRVSVMMSVVVTLGLLLSASFADTPQFKTTPADLSVSTAPAESSAPPAANASASKKPVTVPDSTEPVPAGKKVVAHVVWVKGSFSAAEPGGATSRTLKKSSNVYMNDTVETAPDSEAQIVFTDDSLMTFRAGTKLYINEYNYSPKAKGTTQAKSSGRYVMDLITGGLRTLTGFVAKQNPDNYQVNTPVATIGVRGTEFSIVYQDGKLYMERYKGEPCLANKKDKAKNTLCLDEKNKYGEVAGAGQPPVFLANQPAVFSVDVEVIPVVFSQGGVGFCGPGGCGSGGGATGFCIQ